jgi:predicted ATPase/DNA-binding SARP family transcriptional activator/Tfp pilus assembly protein PilF
MSNLHLYLFGTPRVQIDGTSVDIGRRKASALLAYLALTNQPHNRDALAALLWPEYDQAGARTALRQALKALKTALGGNWVEANWETIRLGCDDSLWIDVEHFRGRLAQCRTHDHAEDDVCKLCLSPLNEAAEIYRDHFLAGFTLSDSPDFDEWQFYQAEQLRSNLTTALDRLVRGYTTQNEFQAAISHAHRLLTLDPLHEPAYCYLMQLYARMNQRQNALRQYEECQRALAELSIAPQPATTQLYEAIRAGEILPQVASDGVQIVAQLPIARRSHLPQPATPFVGRDAELAQIRDQLDNPNCRLLTLVGIGGIGKSRLAIQAAQGKTEQFKHGVHFVSLAALTSHELLASAIALTLRFSFQDGNSPKIQLLNYLVEKEILLVLDNFEHILDAADLVMEILAGAPHVKILATSRERLQLQEEWLLPIGGMDYPQAQATEPIEAHGAIRLFVQSVQRVQGKFSLAENSLAVTRICQLVEGMPLALELAAGWLWTMSCEQVADQIQNNLDFLETSLRNIPERHRSLHAVFDHSWNLLTEPERAGLVKLAVFRSGFTLEATEAIAEISRRMLDSLAQKSLIRRDGSDRYNIHEMLRQYLAQKLHNTPDMETRTQDRHCAYYADFLHLREQRLQRDDLTSARDEIQLEIDNIRAAWNWMALLGKHGEGETAFIALDQFYLLQGWYTEGIAAYANALQQFDRANTTPHERFRAQLLARQGWFYLLLNQWTPGEECLQQSLSLARVLGAVPDIVFALNRLGYGALRQTDYEKATILLEESIAICETTRLTQELSFALNALAQVLEKQSRYDEAVQRFQASLAFARESASLFSIGESLIGLGNVLMARGDYAGARQQFEETLITYRKLGDPYLIAQSLNRLGWASFRQGTYGEAKPRFEQAFSIYREIGNRHGMANALNALGSLAIAEETYEEARQFLEESVAIYREIGIKGGIAVASSNLAGVYLKTQRYDEAERLYKECLLIHEQTGNRRLAANQINNLGQVAYERGQYEAAYRLFQQSLAIAKEIGASTYLLDIIVNRAKVLARTGERESAVKLLTLAARHPASAKMTKDEAIRLLHEWESPESETMFTSETGEDLNSVVAELLDQQWNPGQDN